METKERPIVDSVDALETAIRRVREAEALYARYTQEQVDAIFRAAAIAANQARIPLAKLAVEETGMGVVEDKVIKNNYAAEYIYNAYRNTRTCGVIEEDKAYGMMKIAEPLGVIAAVIPTTNPTSTAIFKCLLALKTRNAIIISPHPRAKKSTIAAARLVLDAAVAAGAPAGIIDWIDMPSLDMTNLLMKEADIILATGGPGMVKAAYSSGKPAIGVGAGNGPAYIHKSADIPKAVADIIRSKTFDNGTVCASEQSIIVERPIAEQVRQEALKQGAYFLSTEEADKVAAILFRPDGRLNPKVVGRSARKIAELAGIQVPASATVLVAQETEVGPKRPYSWEKLCPVLAFYVEENEDNVMRKAVAVLQHEGAGHSFMIHARDEAVIRRFALEIPVSRFLVNTPGALGGIGATTNLFPALTLGCGAVGGSSSSNNIGPLDLINIRRVAWGVREVAGQRQDHCTISETVINALAAEIMKKLM